MAVSSSFDALLNMRAQCEKRNRNAELPVGRRAEFVKCAVPELARHWQLSQKFDKDTVGRFMEPPYALFRPEMTVEEAIEGSRYWDWRRYWCVDATGAF